MYTAQSKDFGPFCIRYPRGKGVMKNSNTPFKKIKIGTGKELIKGEIVACISFGPIGNDVYEIAKELQGKNINIGVYDLRFVKPIDEKLLHKIFTKYNCIITIEDGCVIGGMGSAILEFGAKNNYHKKIEILESPINLFLTAVLRNKKKNAVLIKKVLKRK